MAYQGNSHPRDLDTELKSLKSQGCKITPKIDKALKDLVSFLQADHKGDPVPRKQELQKQYLESLGW